MTAGVPAPGPPNTNETLLALADKARRITGVGHGLRLDEPVNLGSLGWVNAAYDILCSLAILDGDINLRCPSCPPRGTVWVESDQGTGHWASAWELQRMGSLE